MSRTVALFWNFRQLGGQGVFKTGFTGEEVGCRCTGKDFHLGPVESEGPVGYPSEMSSKQMVA